LFARLSPGCASVRTTARRERIVAIEEATAWAQENDLLQTIAVILIVLWLLGFVTSYTLGGFIHVLLVVAIVMILVRVIQGRRVL
jgi:hypothetical protein